MRAPRSLLALTWTLALQPACTPLLHYHVSALEGLPPGVVGAVDASGRALLVLDDLKLALSAIDAVPIRQREAPGPIPSLMVLLEFEPAAPGLSFNAMRLFVRTPDRGRLPAAAYVGPGRMGISSDAGRRQCIQPIRPRVFGPWEQLPDRVDAEFLPLPPGRHTCFVVAFDTTVTLESHVEMAIEGIARQGQQVVVPSLLFSRRSAKSYLIDLRPAALDARGPR